VGRKEPWPVQESGDGAGGLRFMGLGVGLYRKERGGGGEEKGSGACHLSEERIGGGGEGSTGGQVGRLAEEGGEGVPE